jgi:hypothetical protein
VSKHGIPHQSKAAAGCQCGRCRELREESRVAKARARARARGRVYDEEVGKPAPVDWSDVAHVMVGYGVRRRRPTS